MGNWKFVDPQSFFDDLLFEVGGLRKHRESEERLLSDLDIVKEHKMSKDKKILVRGKVVNQQGHRKLYYLRCTSCGGYMYMCLDDCLSLEAKEELLINNNWGKYIRCPFVCCSHEGRITMVTGKELDLFED